MSRRSNVARCPACSAETFARCRALSDPRDVLSVQALILRVVRAVQKCAMAARSPPTILRDVAPSTGAGCPLRIASQAATFNPASPARFFFEMLPRQASRFADSANDPTLNSG
jgi:hypothetical protein